MNKKTITYFLLIGLAIITLVLISRWRILNPERVDSTIRNRASRTSVHTKTPKIDTPTFDENEWRKMTETEARFYGKVIDQYGNGVPNAEIKFSRTRIEGENPGLLPTWSVMSDTEGNFYIHKERAPNLKIGVIAPPGYYLSGEGGSEMKNFNFYEFPSSIMAKRSNADQEINRKHTPDPDNPVIFRLKKMGQADPMVYRVKSVILKSEQDFMIGINSNQTLRIKYWFDPQEKRIEMPSERSMYDWGFELSVVGGGLIIRENPKSTEASSFEAPKDGYQESIINEYNSRMEPKEYLLLVKREYFVRFSDGTHGRIFIDMDANSRRPFATIKSWFNPSGSRATEFDPSKQIKTP